MYAASSSRRACTLRLPSVAFISRFRSLNDSVSFTASALTMPRRTRSWIRRSRASEACEAVFDFSAVRGALTALRALRSLGMTLLLATVPPGDDDAEDDVQ